jgi:hypothetical protein
VFQLSLAFDAMPERLTVSLVAITVVLEKTAAFSRQCYGMITRAGHTNRLDEALLPKVAQVA